MIPEPLLIFSGLMFCAALGYLVAACRYVPRLRRIQRQTWASAALFYSAKAKE